MLGPSFKEAALNKRNKVNMEKVFATVISLSIMIALVVGIVSILKNNKGEENKKNYVDLNEINQVLNETSESAEPQVHVKGTEEATKPDERNHVADIIDPIDNKFGSDKNLSDNQSETVAMSEEDPSNEPEVVAEKSSETESVDVASNESEPETGDEPGEFANATVPDDGTGEGESAQVVAESEPETEDPGELTQVNSGVTAKNYTFGPDSSLMWPTNGEIILNYNMTNTIYFPSLDAYRCNPALVISAPEGAAVFAACDGVVSSIYETRETGLTMEIFIGNDYVLTYGQLKDICVEVGSCVSRGDIIGSIAVPSPYYSVEGSNLYFKMTDANGAVNPMDYLE